MSHDSGATPAAPATAPTPVTRFFARIRALGIGRPAGTPGAGVCAGLAARSGWRVVTVRAIFVVAAFILGAGPIGYGVAWLLLPDEHGRIALEDALRGDFRAAFFGGIALVLLGLPGSSHQIRVGRGNFDLGIPWWLILGAVSLTWAAADRRRRRGPRAPQSLPGPAFGVPAPPASPTPAPPAGRPPGTAEPATTTPPVATSQRPDEPVRRRGPGWRLVAGTLGLAALAGIAGHLVGVSLHRGGLVAAQLTAAVVVVVIGLGIVVAGVRGRRVGVGWLVPALLLFSAPVGFHPDRVGDSVIPVTRLSGWRVDSSVGDTTIDLRRAVRDPGDRTTPEMRLVAGIGDVTVDYPADLAIDTDVGRRLGEVAGAPRHGRVGRRGGRADLRIVLDAGIGDVTFRQVNR